MIGKEVYSALTDECDILHYELARAMARHDDERGRLDWLMGMLGNLAARATSCPDCT